MTQQTPFAVAASDFRAGRATLDTLLPALRDSHIYARRPPQPGLYLVDLGKRGRWTFVFTTLEALCRHASTPDLSSGLDYFSTTGADLLDNLLPSDVGLLVDPDDQHSLVLPSEWLSQVRPL